MLSKTEDQPQPRRKWVKPVLIKMKAGNAENSDSGDTPDEVFTTS